MKIVYFNYLYDSHQDSVGAAVHVKQFVGAMQACGQDIKPYNLNPAPFAAAGDSSLWARIRQVLKSRLKRYVGQLNQLLRNAQLFVREWGILSREKPDVLLVRYNMLNFTAPIVAKVKRVPVVLEVNSPHALERKKLVKDVWQLPWIPFLTEWLNIRLSDRVITVSNALKEYYLEKRVPADKIFVIPNGVDIEKFSPKIKSLPIRKKFGFDDKVVLGFVGSFHYWHGVENLLQLMERTLNKYNNIAYLLVGDGPLKKQAEALVKSKKWEKDVIFTGYVLHEEVPSHVAAMDIVLAPYPHMDFFYFSPLKLYEYLSAGKAVIASAIGQIAEVIEDGRNGFLYDPEHPGQFVEKTCELIEDGDLRERLGREGRKTILKSYTWDKNVRNVLEVFLFVSSKS
ncbi:MAG: glycosyltransferase family 4 protein [bacterium]